MAMSAVPIIHSTKLKMPDPVKIMAIPKNILVDNTCGSRRIGECRVSVRAYKKHTHTHTETDRERERGGAEGKREIEIEREITYKPPVCIIAAPAVI